MPRRVNKLQAGSLLSRIILGRQDIWHPVHSRKKAGHERRSIAHAAWLLSSLAKASFNEKTYASVFFAWRMVRCNRWGVSGIVCSASAPLEQKMAILSASKTRPCLHPPRYNHCFNRPLYKGTTHTAKRWKMRPPGRIRHDGGGQLPYPLLFSSLFEPWSNNGLGRWRWWQARVEIIGLMLHDEQRPQPTPLLLLLVTQLFFTWVGAKHNYFRSRCPGHSKRGGGDMNIGLIARYSWI